MIDAEMRSVVREELALALEELFQLVRDHESGGLSSAELVRRAFRSFHNTKGALRVAAQPRLELLAHCVEDRLAALRDGKASPAPAFVQLLPEALGVILREIETAIEDPRCEELLELLARQAEPAAAPVATPAGGVEQQRAPGPELRDHVRVDAERLDLLMALGGDLLAQQTGQRQRLAAIAALLERVALLARTEREQRALLGPIVRELELLVRRDERELRRGGQLAADFDRAMRAVRMQPLASAVGQLQRHAHETARELGKEIELHVDVGNVELDRQVLDALRDPLLHLLRNAVDHGIETPEVRRRAGKPERGRIAVEARLRGPFVELDVSDDGRGIDAERVVARALELGFAPPADVDKRAFVEDMLFSAGFSTAASVSHVSGRGVGLDVVRARVIELGGQVTVESEPAATRFCLRVPTSVVSLRGLLVRAGDADFVIPSSTIQRTLRAPREDVRSADGAATMVAANGQPLKLRWLGPAMGQSRTDDPALLSVVVVADGQQRLGLVVDEVRGDTSCVIKRLPWNVRRLRGVIGAMQQGDAALALVVDVSQLLRGHVAVPEREQRVQAPQRRRKPRILVADDSLTSRTLERNILSSAGYDVETAVDGDEAWRSLEHGEFDLLVSDVQMPGLDGFELTRRVRAHAKLAQLPVVLVTSLDRADDVARGADAGANEYIVKGRFDQRTLLETVSRLL